MVTNGFYPGLRPVVTITSGGFDPIHPGHVRYLKAAAELSTYKKTAVILNSDSWLINKKGYVVQNLIARAEILREFKCVLSVIPQLETDATTDKTVNKSLRYIKERHGNLYDLIFCKGGDRTEENTPEADVCDELGIKIFYGIGGYSKYDSSQEMIKRIPSLG